MDELSQSVAKVMRMELADIEPAQSLRDLGTDSLVAVEIDMEFSSRTGLDIASAELSAGSSVETLAKTLLMIVNTKLPLIQTSSVTVAA